MGLVRTVVGHAIRNVMSVLVHSELLEVIIRNSKRSPGIDSWSVGPLESSLQFIRDIIARRALAFGTFSTPMSP